MKKKLCSVGMIASALLVLFGILTIAGVLGGNTDTATGAPSRYDSGYATFGADFYTCVTNNAEEAAIASRVGAGNLDEIALLLRNVFGIGFICLGLISGCCFGIVLDGCEKKQQIEAAVQPTEEINSVAVNSAMNKEKKDTYVEE